MDNQPSLKQATGIRSHKRNQLVKKPKTKQAARPKFSSLKPGDPIKLLANEKCYIVRENGERVCVLNYASLPKHVTNKANNLNISVARTYEFFSATDDDDTRMIVQLSTEIVFTTASVIQMEIAHRMLPIILRSILIFVLFTTPLWHSSMAEQTVVLVERKI